jgi:hypothetical protein
MNKPTEELDILLDEVASQETDDVEIQATVKKPRGRPTLPTPPPVYKPRQKPDEPPVKKERTEAQKEATRRMLEARDRNRANRVSVKAQKEDLKLIRDRQIADLKAQAIKEYQDSLVKKAISIKKKEIKRKVELEEIVSDDDTPIEEIRKIVKKAPVKAPVVPVPSKPQITFL